MRIRPERSSDQGGIRAVITSAFLDAEHSDGKEASIFDGLRQAGALTISLVAADHGAIIGHVTFSPVTIDGIDAGWFGLGPVSVQPGFQRKGIGTALIEAGLATLRQRGAGGCVVLGDPDYYRRFGFAVRSDLTLAGVPPECFQQLSFDDLPRSGSVSYHPAFNGG